MASAAMKNRAATPARPDEPPVDGWVRSVWSYPGVWPGRRAANPSSRRRIVPAKLTLSPGRSPPSRPQSGGNPTRPCAVRNATAGRVSAMLLGGDRQVPRCNRRAARRGFNMRCLPDWPRP